MRIILDTNVLISALLFRGSAAGLYRVIAEGKMIPCMSPSIFTEYRRVLSYEKFGLTNNQIAYIIREEILPIFIQYDEPITTENWIPEDTQDNKFVALAKEIPQSILLSGDKHILARRSTLPCKVSTIHELLAQK